MTKIRLRYTSKGWFRYGGSWLLEFRTGKKIPDPRYPGCDKTEMWIGPYATAATAFAMRIPA